MFYTYLCKLEVIFNNQSIVTKHFDMHDFKQLI